MGPWLAITSLNAVVWRAHVVLELLRCVDEQGVVQTPFYGGYGLVDRARIPKAAFRAFELLHQMGDQRIASESEVHL